MIVHNNKGFTFIELLMVLAIMGALLAISIAGVNALRENQYVSQESQNILTSLVSARTKAIDARADANDPWIYGFIFNLYVSKSGAHGYCINKWYDTSSSDYNPTSYQFSYPGSLSELVTGSTPLSINITNALCIGAGGGGLTGSGFADVEDNFYDNRTDYTLSINNNIGYIAYETLTGIPYYFDVNGNYISSITYPVEITFKDTAGNTKYIIIANNNDVVPYIP